MPPEQNTARKNVESAAPRNPRQTRSAGAKRSNSTKKPAQKVKPPKPIALPDGPIALVGLMGVGKTTVGRRLAKELGRTFHDSDDEIEKASGRTVAGYFRDHGEAEFRAGERRVIDRLLDGSKIVLATGGGAFIQEGAREILQDRALTIFLKGDFETIFARVRKKDTRPLLKVADPRTTFKALYEERYPIYETAHITVEIAKGPHDRTVKRVMKAIDAHVNAQKTPQSKTAAS